jgi:hypothetical protein
MGRPGWQAVLKRWDVTDVLVSDEVPLFKNMRSLPDYRMLEESPDGGVVMFERQKGR